MTREQADLAAIKEVIVQYAVRVRTGDLDGWMSLWAEGGVQMPNDAPTRVGKTQIREAMKPAFVASLPANRIRRRTFLSQPMRTFLSQRYRVTGALWSLVPWLADPMIATYPECESTWRFTSPCLSISPDREEEMVV